MAKVQNDWKVVIHLWRKYLLFEEVYPDSRVQDCLAVLYQEIPLSFVVGSSCKNYFLNLCKNKLFVVLYLNHLNNSQDVLYGN